MADDQSEALSSLRVGGVSPLGSPRPQARSCRFHLRWRGDCIECVDNEIDRRAEAVSPAPAPQDQPLTVKEVLVLLFTLTDAASIEIHSGDREPGRYIKREQILAAPAPQTTTAQTETNDDEENTEGSQGTTGRA